MNKTLTIVGVAIAGVAVLGVGGYALADSWLDNKAETEVEAQLLEATGGMSEVGSVDVQLLRQRIALKDIQVDGIEGIATEKLLSIQQLTLDKPNLKDNAVSVDKAKVEGITINIDGDTSKLQSAFFAYGGQPGHSEVALDELADQLSTSNNTTQSATDFSIEQLEIGAIAVNLDLEVPWQTERLQHNITIPATTITDVTDENISEKLLIALGQPAMQELQALFFQQILPTSIEELSEALPAEIDLSDIELPEGVELPENIELPDIKLPQNSN
ncbi:hypothetical protein Lepto7376_3851 [[Leptolyngbya] sp. PCC 7376]|uniref:hypothetical protein n=1 Tax=[Leptolyngbya] sp. PCC 7376 TaxID=111781 RepID=UPI00029F1BFC|nr:hypothetical protein [[Leptolyngbya] sp. PCC 7376]AFY40008.1 hypothetical protein Lepto7376_3851 [[Leptolyngbya] sp. PCC 7376]